MYRLNVVGTLQHPVLAGHDNQLTFIVDLRE